LLGRRAFLLGFAVAVLCGSGAPAACGAEAPLPSHFRDEPDETLIRQLAPGPGFSVTPADPATDLAVGQRRRWAPDLRLLFIDTTVTNNGKVPTSAEAIRVGDWTFRVADSQDGARYQPLTYRNDVWFGSTYWAGPDWTRVGRDWHHPGINTPSVRRFTVPRDGRVTIAGRAYKADTKSGGGDGVRLSIRHGARTVWTGEINGNDTQGVEPKVALDVRKGDAIRFVVHKRGRIYYDTTHWDPMIAYPDGEQFVGSKGFSTKRQGDGGWSYEMEVDPKAKRGFPTVHGLGLNLALREETPSLGRPVAFSHRDALPLFLVADGTDKSGIVAAATPPGPWRFRCTLSRDGRLRVELEVGDEKTGVSLKPGESARLPRVVLGAYRGQWVKGMAMLQRLLSHGPRGEGIDELRKQIVEAFRRLAAPLDVALRPELDLWAMVQADWRLQDNLADSLKSYTAATASHIEKARQLLADLRQGRPTGFLAAEAAQLERLAAQSRHPRLNPAQLRSLYLRVRWLKRQIALANPLMKLGKLLFAKRVPTSYSHLVMQYFGWRARPGGGIFVLEKPGYSLACRDILEGKLANGNVLEPRLSYDAKRIAFSFVKCTGKKYNPGQLGNDTDEGFYHIYEVNVDGTGLGPSRGSGRGELAEPRQLTSGPYDDLMPTYLPDGGIAFCSTRRRGYARCFGGQFSRRWHVYTLHRMDRDGKNIRTLSFHDTNEWFPAVANTGHILYARWDYIDRDAVTHQNLWATRPDGTNPVALWGNATASPHCTFQLQPIPGSSKIVFTASAHHSIAGGSIAIVDPNLGNNGQQAITRITPKIPFPEAEGRNIREYYAAPWPLSENYFLVAYSPKPLVWEPRANSRDALGIYLLDRFGNRELVYRDPDIGSTNPMPLAPRPKPPVVPSALPNNPRPTGEMLLLDVYQGLGSVPRGTIRALRIIQILPKTTNVANRPPIGLAGEENARAILGTVPVEPDGSARLIVPAQKPILFQALDNDGFAYQTMRSVTYLQPGERVSCIGCHEPRTTTPTSRDVMALRRPPSKIDPGPFGGRPFSFVRVVQPVLDKHCVKCHSGEKPKKGIDLTGTPHRGFTKSYWSLCGDRNFWGAGTSPKNAAAALVPRFGARNQVQITPPGGMYGARGSRLLKMLRKGHNDVKLSPDEFRRLAAWIDCNAIFYGAYSPADQALQLRGEALPMPGIQ